MIGDILSALVLIGLAFWFCRYTGHDPIGWAWRQVVEGWRGIGR